MKRERERKKQTICTEHASFVPFSGILFHFWHHTLAQPENGIVVFCSQSVYFCRLLRVLQKQFGNIQFLTFDSFVRLGAARPVASNRWENVFAACIDDGRNKMENVGIN